jgi:hypothetical protein
MNVKILKNKKLSYIYEIWENKTRIFSSFSDYYKLSFCKKEYKNAWSAKSDAYKTASKYKFIIAQEPFSINQFTEQVYDDSEVIEDRMYKHYLYAYNKLSEDLGALDLKDQECRNMFFGKAELLKKEIKAFIPFIREVKSDYKKKDFEIFITHITGVQDKFFQSEKNLFKEKPDLFLPKADQGEEGGGGGGDGGLGGLLGSYKSRKVYAQLTKEDQYELCDDFGKNICELFNNPDLNYSIKDRKITFFNIKDAVFTVKLTSNFILSQITPKNNLKMSYGEFYQKIWKPIAQLFNVIEIEDGKIIMANDLPDLPHNKQIVQKLKGLDIKNKKEISYNITLTPKENKILWKITK